MRIEVGGQNGSIGALGESPKAVALGNDTVVQALVLAPNGAVQTGHRTNATGAHFGRDVLINLDAKVTYQDGFSASGTCGSCDDGNPAASTHAPPAYARAHAPTANGTACSYEAPARRAPPVRPAFA